MQLTYRGQIYTRSQVITSINNHTVFTYRGQSYHHPRSPITIAPKANLVYRDISYSNSEVTNFTFLIPVFN